MKKLKKLILIYLAILIIASTLFQIIYKQKRIPFDKGVVYNLLLQIKKSYTGDERVKPNPTLFDQNIIIPAPVFIYAFKDGIEVDRLFIYNKDLLTIFNMATDWSKKLTFTKGLDFVLEWPLEVGRILRFPEIIFVFSLIPGKDGICAVMDKKDIRCLGTIDMLKNKLYDSYVTLPGGEISSGFNLKRVTLEFLKSEINDDGITPSYIRVSSKLFTINREGALKELFSNEEKEEVVTKEKLIEAGIAGGQYLLRHQREDGSFEYLYYPLLDIATKSNRYSLPRHAGAAYFLALLGRLTKKKEFLAGSKKAIDYMLNSASNRCNNKLCFTYHNIADIGSGAILGIAIGEFIMATGYTGYLLELKSIGDFILEMQMEEGRFYHGYSIRDKTKLDYHTLYYDGESALALGYLYRLTGDKKYLKAIKKALDYLTTKAWNFLGSHYFYSEEHWTCMAVEFIYPDIRSEDYIKFCKGFGNYLIQLQYSRGETPWYSEGGQGFSPYITVRVAPTGGRAEAMVSIYDLLRREGEEAFELKQAIDKAMKFMVHYQYKEIDPRLILMPKPHKVVGGFPASAIDDEIRIDYVQHCGNAIIRWAFDKYK